MNKILIFLGLFFIISAKPLDIVKDWTLDKMGISVTKFGDKIIDSLPTKEENKDIGRKGIFAARIIEKVPLIILIIGIIFLIMGFMIPNKKSFIIMNLYKI